MNQEYNNLNQNNPNTQGINGTNNQPLNSSNVGQNMNVNQPVFNQQPQTTNHISSQQPINTNANNNSYNQNFNSKHPKKTKIGLIIGIVVAVAIVGIGLVFGSKLFLNNGKYNDSSDINSSNSNNLFDSTAEMAGKVNLVKTYKNYSFDKVCGNFFVLESDTNRIVVNSAAEVLAEVSNKYSVEYCNEDKTILVSEGSKSYSVYKEKRKIYSFVSSSLYAFHNYMYYEGGILYYRNEDNGVTAYDLSNQKQLWVTKEGYNPIVLDDVVLLSDDSIIINKKNGQIIDKSNTDYQVYGSYSSYYAKIYYLQNTKWVSKVEIYDYSKKLISSKIFEGKCSFKNIMSNGFYIISCNSEYSVYNFKSELVKNGLKSSFYEDDRIEKDGNSIVTKINLLDNDKISVLESKLTTDPHLIFYSDGRIIEARSRDSSGNNTGVHYLSYQKINHQRTFVFGIQDIRAGTGLLINFLTGQTAELEDVQGTGEELTGGKYFAVTKDSDMWTHKFYDYNLKKLDYETNKSMSSINNEWIFLSQRGNCEGAACNSKFYIANILTGEEKEIILEVDDDPFYVVNTDSIITQKGTNLYLYQIN